MAVHINMCTSSQLRNYRNYSTKLTEAKDVAVIYHELYLRNVAEVKGNDIYVVFLGF